MKTLYVLLYTDALIYLLLIAIAVFVVCAARSKPLRVPWLRVFARPVGMVTLVILLAYTAIGVLDSIHYRPTVTNEAGETRISGEVVSVLDTIAAPLIEHTEYTYSAPFALHSYVQQVVTAADGSKAQVYPRLAHAGTSLNDSGLTRGEDIARRAARGAGWGLAVWLALCVPLIGLIAAHQQVPPATVARAILRDTTPLAWRAALITAGVLAVLVGATAALAVEYHVLGTDKVGQDVLYQAIKSIRTGLAIGTLTTLVMLPFALLLGTLAGYFRGWVDDVIQYLYTTLSSIPGVLLIAAAVLMMQVYMENHAEAFGSTTARADLRLLFLCLILGITSWTGLCRLLRAEVRKLSELDYVSAARGLGSSPMRILGRHMLPNVMHIVLIQVVLDFSALVLAEAVLSYIGVGVDPTMNSWGNMINAARLEMARDPIVWWRLGGAFVFMLVLVLAANLFADVVRDAFDPRLRGDAGGRAVKRRAPAEPAGGAR
ncbi:ABC transporter permease [Salinisphaera sp. T5B8]|uniref:ABC transporter permease n=1 Tax=Salinisphaera sp. T5B8 TaxID=1304154 RepID=UPI003341D71F